MDMSLQDVMCIAGQVVDVGGHVIARCDVYCRASCGCGWTCHCKMSCVLQGKLWMWVDMSLQDVMCIAGQVVDVGGHVPYGQSHAQYHSGHQATTASGVRTLHTRYLQVLLREKNMK